LRRLLAVTIAPPPRMEKTLLDDADSPGHRNSPLTLAEGAAADAGCSRSSDESFVSLASEDQAERDVST